MDATEIKALIEEQGRAFEAFKAEHSAALNDVKKGTEDVVRTEKVDRINATVSDLQAALDEQAQKLAALQTAGASHPARDIKNAEYTKAFDRFFRKGDEASIDAFIQANPQAAMSVAVPEDGGYTAPTEWDRTITDKLKIVSPMRGIASVIQISGNGFSKLYNDRATASGWVGEAAERPETLAAKFAEVKFNTAKSTRILRQRSACWTIPKSISKTGLPVKSRPSSPIRKALRSFPEMAPTSPRVC